MEGAGFQKQKGIIMSILGGLGWDKSESAEARIQAAAADLVSWLSDAGKHLQTNHMTNMPTY